MSVAGPRRALKVLLLLIGLALLIAPNPARPQPVEVPGTWGGDFWTRPRLTGDWDGLRDDLAKNGIMLDADLLLTPQGVISGGRSTGGDFWGNADYTLNVDTDKLGLWLGGFFRVSGDSGFGANAFKNSGSIVPVNTAALIPAPDDNTTALMNATLMQFLSPQLGLLAGKIDMLDANQQEFYGDYRTQFLNTALMFPMTLEQVPLSAFGGGVIVLPQQNIALSALVLDPNGSPTSNNLGDAFSEGVMLVGSGKLTVTPFGLVGHQNVGFSWSNEERFSLDQAPSNIATFLLRQKFPGLGNSELVLEDILARFFPNLLAPQQPANRTNSTWSINYAFDQYLWQPPSDAEHGIGVFFSFGASDGNPNPIQYVFTGGIGGKGIIPDRADDTFGVGFARTQFSSAFVPFLRQQLDLGLQREDAIEIYYNAVITGWLNLSPDLQIVNPGLRKTLGSSGQLVNVDTAVIGGLRLRARF